MNLRYETLDNCVEFNKTALIEFLSGYYRGIVTGPDKPLMLIFGDANQTKTMYELSITDNRISILERDLNTMGVKRDALLQRRNEKWVATNQDASGRMEEILDTIAMYLRHAPDRQLLSDGVVEVWHKSDVLEKLRLDLDSVTIHPKIIDAIGFAEQDYSEKIRTTRDRLKHELKYAHEVPCRLSKQEQQPMYKGRKAVTGKLKRHRTINKMFEGPQYRIGISEWGIELAVKYK